MMTKEYPELDKDVEIAAEFAYTMQSVFQTHAKKLLETEAGHTANAVRLSAIHATAAILFQIIRLDMLVQETEDFEKRKLIFLDEVDGSLNQMQKTKGI